MKHQEKILEEEIEEISQLDWDSLNEQDKQLIIEKQLLYLDASRKFIFYLAIHRTDFRSLLIFLFLTLIMSLTGIENKTIVLTLLTMQFVLTVMSKLSETFFSQQLMATRSSYKDVLKNIKKK